jgi:xylulokinase
MKHNYIIAIDIGTTAIKTGIFSVNGECIGFDNQENPVIFLENGWVEQNPDESWKVITNSVNRLTQNIDKRDVRALSLSVQRGTVIPLNERGEPLHNFVLWMDQRGLPLLDKIKAAIHEEAYYKIAGHPITYISGLSKLIWFQQEASHLWEKIHALSSPETFFLKRLGCEEFVCAQSSGTYLFPFDIRKKVWSKSILTRLNFSSNKLPKVVSSVEVVGFLSKKASGELGLNEGIPLIAGGGDGQCAAAGCGVIDSGKCMVNLGTGCGVQTFLPEPLFDPNRILNCAAHVVPSAWEMEGHTQASGAVLKWFRDQFGGLEKELAKYTQINAFDQLVQQAILSPPGSRGLICIPTLNGSTAPVSAQEARGLLIGLSLAHKRSEVIRSMLEGITLEIRWLLDAICDAGVAIDEVRLAGGGSNNPHWNQIHADILGRPIIVLKNPEAALVGAAMCGAVAISEYSNFAEASAKGNVLYSGVKRLTK